MKIAMANDHAGTKLKLEIKAWLESQGHEVQDFVHRWQLQRENVIAEFLSMELDTARHSSRTKSMEIMQLSVKIHSALDWLASIPIRISCVWAERLSVQLSRWKLSRFG